MSWDKTNWWGKELLCWNFKKQNPASILIYISLTSFSQNWAIAKQFNIYNHSLKSGRYLRNR